MPARRKNIGNAGFAKKRARKKRDYAAEYQRRIARALAKGLTRSQGRGHPKANERLASTPRKRRQVSDAKLQRALTLLRKEKSLARAAKAANVSPERLKREAIEKKALVRRGRKWGVRHNLPRQMLVYSGGRAEIITVGSFKSASLIGKYMSAVSRFLITNDAALLKPFVGRSVSDTSGKKHLFETNPNALYRITSSGGETFESVYRIVV